MIITKLKVANLRAIEQAEFNFKPGFNLIVGINGVGKTSILDTLNICLSAVTKNANTLDNRPKLFKDEDIRIGAKYLTVECNVLIDERNFSYFIHKPHKIERKKDDDSGDIDSKAIKKTKQSKFIGDAPATLFGKEAIEHPIAIFFSTNRAVPTDKKISNKILEKGGMSVVYANVFSKRELRLGDFTDWLAAQVLLAKEHPLAQRKLDACQETVSRFLPNYRDLHVKGSSKGKQLWIYNKDTPIPVRQLSDGERGVLALILDITRWLAQANPEISDPAAESEAVILIDEIELHLHPKWQREIVKKISDSFPKCQFIATTHSPQVFGEVKPDKIHIISDGKIFPPDYSFGVDSNRILEEIMDTDPRTHIVKKELSEIANMIRNKQFEESRLRLDALDRILKHDDPEVTRLRAYIEFSENDE